MMNPMLGLRGLMVFCAAGALAAACSSSTSDGAGAGGQGGANNPNGGSNTGGQQNGASGSGGTTSSAGNATGGNNSGGNNTGGSNGGTANGGTTNGGANGGGTAGTGGTPAEGGSGGNSSGDLDGGGMGGASLEECFQGLRDGVGTYQDATKVSMGGEYRFRLALETADRFGTSGTVPWLPYRFAIDTPDGSVCVTEETALMNAYTGSHHNCDDTFSWTDGALRYEIGHPDTAVDRPSSLTIYEGQDVIAGPIRLDLETCHFSNGPNDECRSGGPC